MRHPRAVRFTHLVLLSVLLAGCTDVDEGTAQKAAGPLKINVGEGGGSMRSQNDRSWWGSFGLPVCTTEDVTIDEIDVEWSGAALDDDAFVYASPPGQVGTRARGPFGAAPGRPPVFGEFVDMGDWVVPADGAEIAQLSCDAQEAGGRFAELIISGRTDGRGARAEEVTVRYHTSGGQEHEVSSSTWGIILCGTEARLDDPESQCLH